MVFHSLSRRRLACVGLTVLLIGHPASARVIVESHDSLMAQMVPDFKPRDQSTSSPRDAVKKSGLPPDDTRITTDHLVIVVGSVAPGVVPGSRVSLVLDVRPRSGVHVYAPGNPDYRPVGLRIDRQPTMTVHPTSFPPADDFYFKPLDEHVKVYEKPFRLVQDITLSTSPEARRAFKASPSLTVTGSFDYQACDDRVCFAPTSVPVTWTLTIKNSDR